MAKKPPKAPADDAVMDRVRTLFEGSGLSLHELGVKMGYPEDSARKSVWQFLKTTDPRLSMLRRFAAAMTVPLAELVKEGESRRPPRQDTQGLFGSFQ